MKLFLCKVGLNCSRSLGKALLISFVGCIPVAAIAQEPRACRSVHLWFPAEEGVAFYNEVTVTESTRGTYFMACGFSKGYFGIQELGNNKKVVLFSVWEPGEQNNPNATPEERRVKTLEVGDGIRVKRFGGEGTGGQSFLDYDWKIGETCRFLVYAQADGDRTQYAGYFYVNHEKRWQHLATFSTLAEGQLLQGLYSFVEDFRRDGESVKKVHRAMYGNGWLKNKDGSWQSLEKSNFTGDSAQLDNIDAGMKSDRFFLATGGETKNENVPLNGSMELEKHDRKPPLDLPLGFQKNPANQPARIRVLTYNIKHGQGNDGQVDLNRIAEAIRRLNPDMVALQEIDKVTTRTGRIDQAKFLGEATQMESAFGTFFDYQGGEYGMAVLSRWPIHDAKNIRLPDGAEPRSSLLVSIEVPPAQKKLLLADVHFYETETERVAQAQTLLGALTDNQIPTLIAGDFNSHPQSSVLKLFRAEWSVADKGTDAFTFSSDQPKEEIDYILFRPKSAFKVLEVDVINEPLASDHRPVVMELEFNR